ncbi:MAG TPA: glycerate kinase [Puia sp.]|jgi:glycerate kinase
MHILIAPNAFKNSLPATAAAEAILAGLKQSRLRFSHECFPIGDGGNGTAELLIRNQRGRMISGIAHDPLGRKIRASFGLIREDRTAVIEMADAAGLQFLKQDELDPLKTSSSGCGEMIRQALDQGVRKIILGMGGSATVDGGTGILRALGIRFLDACGNELPDRPESLINLDAIDLSGMDKRILEAELIILCDVNNPLLGSQGAAAVFGPQKGATKEGVKKLEAALTKFQELTLRQTGKEIASLRSGGTAGGAAAGLHAFLNARLVSGIEYFLELTGFDEALRKAGLLITGEGAIDEQTLQGKAPFGVASRAKERNLPVIALAGKVPLEKSAALDQYFDVLLAIGNEPADLTSAMKETTENLTRISKSIGNLLALP